MSPQEAAWRVRSTLRDVLDRCRLPLLRRTTICHKAKPAARDFRPGFATTAVTVGEWAEALSEQDRRTPTPAWLSALLDRADQIAAGRLSFFDQEARDLGRPIDWNRDHGSGKRAPLRFASWVDYRDFSAVGDAKFVWEPNRHHQLVALGRAYRASGEERYATAVAEQLASWLEQCPFGVGMNWRSPLELAVRLINWVWALDLIRPADVVGDALWTRVLDAAYQHLWEITRKYSRGSSANNHRVGEAAGVFIAARYFDDLRNAARWAAEARDMLCEEITAQTYPDGGTREQALGYQAFVMQFFLLAGLVGRWTGMEFPAAYWERLERMFGFGAGLLEGGDPVPLFGDCDDGHVLDLGRAEGDWRAWLPVAAVLFERGDFKAVAGTYSECAAWLLGPAGEERYARLPSASDVRRLTSRAFPASGYYLLQHGSATGAERISVLFDCGELGFGPLAAHGHADALSFGLRALGVDILVDPGTYDYFTHPEWRSYFRSTRAHNTIEIDGVDQSVMEGPFLWGARARAKCVSWHPDASGGCVSGEHDGYTRLPDPVVHRRTLKLDGPQRVLAIHDDIETRGQHDVALCFHFSEECAVLRVDAQRVEVAAGAGRIVLEFDPSLHVSLLHGSESPIGGWVSRGYHRKRPATTVVGRCSVNGDTSLVSRVEIGPPG